MAFASSSERSRKRWNRLSLVPPLMGFECRPPAGKPPARPLPGAEAPFGPTLPSADSCSALVVSHHLNGLLRTGVTGLLHPATGQGFAAFCACRLPGRPKALGSSGCPPRDAVHTLRRVPLASSRTASLRPLPSCRYCPARRSRRPRPVVLADRRSPRRVAYTLTALPAGRRLTLPREAGGRFPCEMGVPASKPEVSAAPRSAGGSGWNWLRRAPKSSACPVPVRLGSRRSEECRLPGPVRPDVPAPGGTGSPALRRGPVRLFRRGGAPSAPKGGRFPVPAGWGALGSEEPRVPCPGWGGARGAPRGAVCPVPTRSGSQHSEECRPPDPVRLGARASEESRVLCPGGAGYPSRWNGVRGAPKSSGCPVPVRWGWSWPGRNRSAEPPRRPGFPAPVEWGALDSEEPLVPCSERGGARGAPRSAVCPVPVRPGSRRSEECRLPGPGWAGGPTSGGGGLWPGWDGSAEPPRRPGFPVPVGWGALGSEEPLVPCPVEVRRAMIRKPPLA